MLNTQLIDLAPFLRKKYCFIPIEINIIHHLFGSFSIRRNIKFKIIREINKKIQLHEICGHSIPTT